MRKVAIVGVEGAGKTVMLAGLGELYSQPDEAGYFLAPKNFSTVRYVNEKIAKMRQGQWPTATPEDLMQGLDWTLRRKMPGERPVDVCAISCLDFAGEVYRAAFCSDGRQADSEEAASLKRYVAECDDLIVLINLRDVIANGLTDARVQQSAWITNEILKFALDDPGSGTSRRRKPKRAAIVLSQADSYMNTIDSCGGAAGVLEKYLPHVYNSYDWLDIFEASAVDLIQVDGDGNAFPHPDFTPALLQPIMEWIKKGAAEGGSEPEARAAPPRQSAPPPPSSAPRNQVRANQTSPKTSKETEKSSKRKDNEELVGKVIGIIIVLISIILKVKGCSS